MNNYNDQTKLERLFQEAQTYALLKPIRSTQAKYLNRAFLTLGRFLTLKKAPTGLGRFLTLKEAPTGLGRFKAAKYVLQTAWAALTQTLESKGAL